VIHASEDRALAVWQELYPDHWLLLEVTHEEDSEPLTVAFCRSVHGPSVGASVARAHPARKNHRAAVRTLDSRWPNCRGLRCPPRGCLSTEYLAGGVGTSGTATFP